jgi:hypothetical protein
MSQRTKIEIICFPHLISFSEDIGKVINLNQMPEKEGWAVVFLVPNKEKEERRLLLSGLATSNSAEAWVLSVFRPKTYDVAVIPNYLEHFEGHLPTIAKTGTRYVK